MSNLRAAFGDKRAGRAEEADQPVSPITKAERPETITITIRLTPEQWRRVKELSMNERRPIQQLALSGLSRFFTDQGLPPLI